MTRGVLEHWPVFGTVVRIYLILLLISSSFSSTTAVLLTYSMQLITCCNGIFIVFITVFGLLATHFSANNRFDPNHGKPLFDNIRRDTATECGICCESFDTTRPGDVRILECSHKVHRACIEPWLQVCCIYRVAQKTGPLCYIASNFRNTA